MKGGLPKGPSEKDMEAHMATDVTQLARTWVAREFWGREPGKEVDHSAVFAKATLVCVAADGELSPSERDEVLGGCAVRGIPAAVIDELRSYDAKDDLVAGGTPEDGAGPAHVRPHRADHVHGAAMRAPTRHGRHVAAEQRLEQAGQRVPIELALEGRIVTVVEHRGLLAGHVPVGPKRSVRTRSAGKPSRTRALAASGCNVVINGFGDAAVIEKIRSSIEAEHKVKCLYIGADMTRPADIEAMFVTTREKLGPVAEAEEVEDDPGGPQPSSE